MKRSNALNNNKIRWL